MTQLKTASGIEAATGIGAGEDARAAGREAARQALAKCKTPQLLVACLSYKGRDAEVLAGIREAAGPVPLVAVQAYGSGAMAGGQYAGENSTAVLALGGRRIQAGYAAVENAARNLAAAGHRLGESLAGCAPKAVMLLVDASVSHSGKDIREFTRALHESLPPATPVVGGNAQDGCDSGVVYDGERPLANGVVGIALQGDIRVGLGAAHSFRELAGPMPVTRADGLKVYELGGRPVSELFSAIIGEPREKVVNDISHAVRQPFAIPAGGRNMIRLQRQLLSDGSFAGFPHPLEPGTPVHIMRHHKEELLSSARACAEEAMADLKVRPAAAFVFPCIGRWGLGNNPAGECRTLRKAFGARTPLFGLYSAGEYYTNQWRGPEARLHYFQISICAMVLGE